MSEMPRLIWTSNPDGIEMGEITIEIKLRRELADILAKEAAKRNMRQIDVVADIFESVLLMCGLPGTSEFDEQVETLMEKLWG